MKMYPGYGWNYETLANEPGLNGYAIWESYVAGLTPTNQGSRFTSYVTFVNSSPVINLALTAVMRKLLCLAHRLLSDPDFKLTPHEKTP